MTPESFVLIETLLEAEYDQTQAMVLHLQHQFKLPQSHRVIPDTLEEEELNKQWAYKVNLEAALLEFRKLKPKEE